VAKYTGEYKRDAQTLLQEIGFIPPGGGKIVPEDFAEARSAGRDALDQVQLLRYNIDKLALQLPKATGDKKKELQEQVTKLEGDLSERQADAVRYFQLALALADDDVSLNDKNTMYYFLCYLYYKDSKYYDAAVIGEFLARHFPAGVGAKNCAKIAMASYLKLYKAKESEDKDFEIRRAVDIADYIVNKWPTQPEAQEALATLIPFMIKLGQLDDAEQYLQKIDEKSPKRGESELTTGQAMWAKYLIGMQDIRNAEKAEGAGETVDRTKLPDQAELDDLKKRAEKTLANGIERMKQAAAVDATLAMAALSLAQIYVDTQQPAKAVELLEDQNIGPKTLVEKEDPSAEREAYKIETHKVALRAYIGALPTVSGPQEGEAMMAKAEGVMNALKKLMGTTPEGQRRLIGIYISLATDIEKQIQNASAEAKTALTKGFEVFLTRVGDATKDVKEMFWVAQTLYALAEGSDQGGPQLTPDAEHFYNKAITAYNKILDLAKTNKEITPDMILQVQMRLATTQRRLGQYQDAINLFEKILLQKNMMLNVQVEAARTYQEWGAVGDPVVYDRAILGGRTNDSTGKYTIWGWGKIANQTAPDPDKAGGKDYEDTFYEARYNLARCRFLKARKEKTTADRKKYFQLAKNDVALTYRFYPALGGEAWKAKFDGLLRDVQKELGEKQLGIEGLGELDEGPKILKSGE
jgi:tetratricopeptide (TPR) repeat protein